MGNLDDTILRALYVTTSTTWIRDSMIFLTCIGSGWMCVTLVPLFLHLRSRSFAKGLAGTLVITAAVVFVLKHLVCRVRPCVAFRDIPALWGSPIDGSFPSGHASGAFAVASFVTAWLVADRTASARALVGGLWIVATGVAISRVFLGVHYPTDVIGAAFIGSAIGSSAGRFWRVRMNEREPSAIAALESSNADTLDRKRN